MCICLGSPNGLYTQGTVTPKCALRAGTGNHISPCLTGLAEFLGLWGWGFNLGVTITPGDCILFTARALAGCCFSLGQH